MTVTAADKKAPPGRPLGKSAGAATRGRGDRGAGSSASDLNAVSPQPASRRRQIALTPMRQETAKRMRKLAASVQESHPDMSVHDHLRDAARTLESGNEEASQRHLRAAMFALTPQSLMRNGLHTDDHHQAARQVMHGVHRHLLLVKDITDAAAKNQAAIRHDSYGDDSSSPPPVTSPVRANPNAGYGPGALAQKPTARQPPGDQALNAPNRAGTGKPDPNVADPAGPQPRGSKQFTTRNGVRAVTELAYGWNDLDAVIEFSAKTAALEVTPAPYGKPGGPGLYGVKGNAHSPYFEQVVKALMEKRGMDKGRASAIAWSALRKWSAKSKHPEVRAAAAGGLGLEKVAEARAHAHAVTWDEVAARVVDLATAPPPAAGSSPKQQAAAKQARVAAGNTGGGQFTTGGGSQPDAHQQHVAHMQHLAAQKSKGSATASKTAKATAGGKAQQKAALQQKAAGFRAQADALIKQRDALRAALASASGKTSSGQSGSTTSSGASTTKSTAPAAASTAPAAATTASSTAPASTAGKTSTSASSTSLTSAQKAQIGAQIAQLNTQIVGLQAQYAQAMAQAAKL